MIINGKEFGISYDQLTIVRICEELGLEYVDDLSAMYAKAFGDTKKTSVAAVKIQVAMIYACLNRWCERNDKNYGITKNEVVDLDSEKLQEVLKEIFSFIAANSPKGDKESKKKEAEPA